MSATGIMFFFLIGVVSSAALLVIGVIFAGLMIWASLQGKRNGA